jgi:hypothetical protein
MSGLTHHQQNIKAILAIFCLALILPAEALLAKSGRRDRDNKPVSNSSSNQKGVEKISAPEMGSKKALESNDRLHRESGVRDKNPELRAMRGHTRKDIDLRVVDNAPAASTGASINSATGRAMRNTQSARSTGNNITNNTQIVNRSKNLLHVGDRPHRSQESRAFTGHYRDHGSLVRPVYCHDDHLYRRTIRPRYHRKYIFVTFSGWWPAQYRYMRYYWYGCSPYEWYDYYPVTRDIQSDTYNYYYTDNYYYGSDAGATVVSDGIRPVDHTTFQDVRERMAQQAAEEPASETVADTYFEEAVEAFEKGDFDTAAEKFSQASELAPEDVILPFAYAQALFAGEKYTQAAEVLRFALETIEPENQGVFFPRGLYPDEQTLSEQIEKLSDAVRLSDFESDLQLLLGYQLFGIGETEEAIEPLQQAILDAVNHKAATVLSELLEKIKMESKEENDT